jgi:hypothetical protein
MRPAVPPVVLEVLAHIPTDFFHCAHCERLFDVADVGTSVHKEVQASYPQDMLEDAQRLGQGLEDLSDRYHDRLRISIVDVNSPQGFLKALRYRVRRYPAFIINGRRTLVGWDPAGRNRMLEEEMTTGTEPVRK